MEMGTLSVGCGALTASIFGMNLTSTLEQHPTAFFWTTGGVAILVAGVFAMCARRYVMVNRDFASAKRYQALKSLFSSVEVIERALLSAQHDNGIDGGSGPIDRRRFHALLRASQLSPREVDSVFRELDENHDGIVDIEELSERVSKMHKQQV